MSVTVTWICDGCGVKGKTNGKPDDWKRITVSLEGLDGYPLWKGAGDTESYELCTGCQKRLYYNARPSTWTGDEDAAKLVGPA